MNTFGMFHCSIAFTFLFLPGMLKRKPGTDHYYLGTILTCILWPGLLGMLLYHAVKLYVFRIALTKNEQILDMENTFSFLMGSILYVIIVYVISN